MSSAPQRKGDTRVRAILNSNHYLRDGPSTTVDYELDLCDNHADKFQLDMSAWTRVATEVEPEHFFQPQLELPKSERVIPLPDVVVVPTPKITEPVAPALDYIPPAAMRYKFSDHAEMRLATRGPEFGFDRRDVLLAVANGVTYPVEDDPKKKRKTLGPASVAVAVAVAVRRCLGTTLRNSKRTLKQHEQFVPASSLPMVVRCNFDLSYSVTNLSISATSQGL